VIIKHLTLTNWVRVRMRGYKTKRGETRKNQNKTCSALSKSRLATLNKKREHFPKNTSQNKIEE
jgi:hypothetical protein